MIYWLTNKETNYNHRKEAINFFNEYNIKYKKIDINKLTYNDLLCILNMDETVEPYKILHRKVKNKQKVYKNKKMFCDLLRDKNIVYNIILDPEKGKVCYGINENIRKFIPREIREAQMNYYLKKLKEMDEENEEKHHLSDEFLE